MPLRGNLRGGPNGTVHSARGDALEGIMVQLIAPDAVHTTVYSNQDGQYEFPKLPAGFYTLRIAKPLQFLPYQREAVKVDGATALDDIVLEPRYATDYLRSPTRMTAGPGSTIPPRRSRSGMSITTGTSSACSLGNERGLRFRQEAMP